MTALFIIGCGFKAPQSLHSPEQVQGNARDNLRKEELALQAGESVFGFNLRKLINNYRRDKGLSALGYDPHLQNLAMGHNKRMNRLKVLSHDGFDDRFKRSGYRLAVENVAYNYLTAREQFQGWRNSTGHNNNMLHPGISHVGISKVGSYVTFFACGNKK